MVKKTLLVKWECLLRISNMLFVLSLYIYVLSLFSFKEDFKWKKNATGFISCAILYFIALIIFSVWSMIISWGIAKWWQTLASPISLPTFITLSCVSHSNWWASLQSKSFSCFQGCRTLSCFKHKMFAQISLLFHSLVVCIRLPPCLLMVFSIDMWV